MLDRRKTRLGYGYIAQFIKLTRSTWVRRCTGQPSHQGSRASISRSRGPTRASGSAVTATIFASTSMERGTLLFTSQDRARSHIQCQTAISARTAFHGRYESYVLFSHVAQPHQSFTSAAITPIAQPLAASAHAVSMLPLLEPCRPSSPLLSEALWLLPSCLASELLIPEPG